MDYEMKPPGKWGEFEDDSDHKKETAPDEIITPQAKVEKLKKIKKMAIVTERRIQIKLKNRLVTQTVEVMNQTEMLQTLIDTYANKSGFNNYLLNPCQIIPQIDFPAENTAELINDDKFAKPLWFIPPIETDFVRGVPRKYAPVSKELIREVIRKSVCGLLRNTGFTDASNTALVTFTDAVDEFLKNLLTHVNDVRINQGTERNTKMDILMLEKGYFSMTQNSLMAIHNFFKNDIIARNRSEINEFKEIHNEYDKMMKESQNIKYREDDFMNFLDFSSGTAVACNTATVTSGQHIVSSDGNVNIMSFLKNENSGNQGNFQDIFEGEIIETTQASQNDYSTTQSTSGSQITLESYSLKHL